MSVLLNDVYSIQAVGACFGQLVMFTHHYAVTGVAGTPDDVDTLDAILARISGGGDDALETAYLNCIPAQYRLARWKAQKVQATRTAYRIDGRDVPGNHGDDTETVNQCATLTLTGVLGRRDNISNKHIGPIPQNVSAQDNGLITDAYKTLLGLLAVALLDTQVVMAGAVTLKPCILHPAPAGSYTLLKYYALGNAVGTMRRRTVGRGK